MVACPFRALVVMYRILPLFTEYKITNVWYTVARVLHLPMMIAPMDLGEPLASCVMVQF